MGDLGRRRPRCALPLAMFLGLGLAAWSPPAAADGELPAGKFGVVGGLRQGVGSLGNQFGLGAIVGVQAGYQPAGIESPWSFGIMWSVLWGWFEAEPAAVVNSTLRVLEMSLGGKMLRRLGEGEPRFVALGAGGTLLRTNLPIPPDNGRLYAGPYAAVGLEQYLVGRYLLSLEARHGLLVYGPSSLTILLSLSFGSN